MGSFAGPHCPVSFESSGTSDCQAGLHENPAVNRSDLRVKVYCRALITCLAYE